MLRRSILAVLIFSLFFSPATGAAGLAEAVQSDNYAVRAPARLLNGALNFVFSWTHLFSETGKSLGHDGQKPLNAIGDGITSMIEYIGRGAWDIVTFWVPGERGKEMAHTEMAVQEFHEDLHKHT